MEAELQDLHSENGTLRFPQNSPADFASIARYQNVQNNNEMTQLPLNELIVSHSQSLTPASALGNQSSLSRTSTSDEQTPFRALLPLTPTANFDDSSVYPLVDSFFASRAGSLGYGSSDVGEAQQQQEYDDFGSPSFNKGFVVHPTTDFFEGWR